MRSTETAAKGGSAALQVEGLDVFYGQAHALQGVSLSLGDGVLAVVGRNGMGKTSLCKAITGMVAASGSVKFGGEELLGRSPDVITHLGVAYVPQGRRVWRSLTVDETLRLAARTARQGAWTIDRVYQVFPRLAERRGNGGGQLSGGEQQMLAIGRALLFNPRLIVMDEPTEGLAPVIVEQVATLLKSLADERSMSVLLIEQNLGVALEVADQVAIMVNGRVAHCVPAAMLAADRALQQRLLGLKAGASDDAAEPDQPAVPSLSTRSVLRVVRAHGTVLAPIDSSRPVEAAHAVAAVPPSIPANGPGRKLVYLAGAWEAHARQLSFVKRSLERLNAKVVSVDIASSGPSSMAQIGVRELLRHRPHEHHGLPLAEHVPSQTLATSFAAYLASRDDLGALLVIARAEDAEVACAGALALPTGVPKMLVCDRPLPGTSADVVTLTAPIHELNRVSESLLGQAAAAVAAMLGARPGAGASARPLICITSLELTSVAVRNARRALGEGFDCLVLDMAADGAQTLARLAGSGLLAGVIDVAPVDVPTAIIRGDEHLVAQRFEALAASGTPYLLVPALLDVALFPLGQAVSSSLIPRGVLSVKDGSAVQVTRDEARRVGDWLASQLDRFTGPVHISSPRPTADVMQRYGGGDQSTRLQQAIHAGLVQRLKTKPGRVLSEAPDALEDIRFGEALGKAMRNLIQGRLAA